MDKNVKVRAFEISFGIVEDIISFVNFETKEQVLEIANKALILARNDKKLDEAMKLAYESAYKKLSSMTLEEMQDLKDAILD